jgi:protein-tyrosine-phosphatase
MRILFLCIENSGKGQMAEGLARCRFGNRVFVSCASSNPTQANSYAREAMKELGVDIGVLNPVPIETISVDDFDFVITLTNSDAHLSRPGKAKWLYWPMDDPVGHDPSLAAAALRQRYTRTRDLIHAQLAIFESEHLD